jgi:hypothetical protein
LILTSLKTQFKSQKQAAIYQFLEYSRRIQE